MRYSIIFAFIAVLGLVLFAGCENALLPIPDPPIDTTSPVGVAKSVEDAINSNNMNKLLSLYSNDMRFYFDLNEVGTEVDGHTVPEFWDGNTDVSKIGLTITNGITLEVNIDENNVGAPVKGGHVSPQISFTADYQYAA